MLLATLCYRSENVRVELRDPSDHIQRFWADKRFYEAETNGILHWLYANCKGWRFVDIGASIGNHTLFALSVLGAKEVVSIEPLTSSYEHLLANVNINTFNGKHTTYNVACGESLGTCRMQLLDGTHNIGMVKVKEGTGTLVVPLDILVAPSDTPTVVKVDVEGYTIPLLRGAQRLLQSMSATWVIEVETQDELIQVDALMAGYERLPRSYNPTPTYVYIPTERGHEQKGNKVRINHGRVSSAIRHPILKGLSLSEYQPEKHTDEPCFFVGMYKQEDLDAVLAHRGVALVMFCGGDARNAKWTAEKLNALPRPWVQTLCASSLEKALQLNGVRVDVVRNVYAGDPSKFIPGTRGKRVYCYVPWERRDEYGLGLLTMVAKELPDVEFLLARWGDHPLPFPNAVPLPAWLDPRMMPAIYGDCCCTVRTVVADGFPTGIVEGALCGLPGACRHDHGVPWITTARTTEDFTSFIRAAQQGSLPNPTDAAREFVSDTSFLDITPEQSGRIVRASEPDLRGKIVAIMLANNRAHTIREALLSIAPHVDGILLINTGITDNTIEIARETVGDKLVVRQWAWQDHFGEARNAGLQIATELGAGWGVFCDTDMRYEGAENIRAAMTPMAPGILYVTSKAGCLQSLVFRLPTELKWTRRAHNVVCHSGEQRVIPGVITWEAAKTPEQMKERFKTTLRLLLQEIEEDPKSCRGWYYLGDTYSGLGDNDKALEAFRKCADLWGWDEEAAWACFQAGYILYTRKDWAGALHECVRGLEHHAGIAELCWLAGLVNQRMGKHKQAVYWATMGLVWAKNVDYVKRVGFRRPVVLKSGLWDVLRFSLRYSGDPVGAENAEREYQEAVKSK